MSGAIASRAAAGLLHIEDEPIWIDAVAQLQSSWPEVRYLGSAMTGTEGVDLCRKKHATIVLLNLWLPDANGFEVAEQLSRLSRPPRVLLFTWRFDDMVLYRMNHSPVYGLVWKTHRFREQLRSAVSAILAGQHYFPPEVQAELSRFHSSPFCFAKILSRTEIDLLPRLGEGATDQEIAAEAGLSASTVKWHRQRIMAKLGFHRTIDLIRWARLKGFVEDQRPAPPCAVG
ncbi:MAG: response regulator transcription factor [Opitutaceae bacterium]|nr:response regulator transcription factor [Opitutaceae bacterium]